MLLTGAILSSFQSLKDKTLKLVFETQEPTPELLGSIANLTQKFGYLAFKKENFSEEEKQMIASLKTDFDDKGKSQSQRLRGVLYRNWELNNKGYDVFPDYYRAEMERLINHFKGKLD